MELLNDEEIDMFLAGTYLVNGEVKHPFNTTRQELESHPNKRGKTVLELINLFIQVTEKERMDEPHHKSIRAMQLYNQMLQEHNGILNIVKDIISKRK